MSFIKKFVITILAMMVFTLPTVYATNMVIYGIMIYQGHEALKQDAQILSSILEQENCLSLDEIEGTSRYARYVNETLRASENDFLKYNIEVKNNKIQNNLKLGADSFSKSDDEDSPLQVSSTSYTTCPNRGDVVTASLTLYVYGPTVFKKLEGPDKFCKQNHRMKHEITQKVEVIGMKKYKGKD